MSNEPSAAKQAQAGPYGFVQPCSKKPYGPTNVIIFEGFLRAHTQENRDYAIASSIQQ